MSTSQRIKLIEHACSISTLAERVRYGAPTAYVVGRSPMRSYVGAVEISVVCPFCGRRHTHGGLAGERVHGYRVAIATADVATTSPRGRREY